VDFFLFVLVMEELAGFGLNKNSLKITIAWVAGTIWAPLDPVALS
jgi:hypothetical protein